jgi:3-hexulose-6-phosphate synthase / 6-phospho-3-hexuloisomerase
MTTWSNEFLVRCSAITTSTWSDALDLVGITGVIQGLVHRSGAGCIAGLAVTVKEIAAPLNTYSTEAFAVGKFIEAITAGTVLVIAMDSAPVSSFGGLAAQAIRKQGAHGVVIDGGCRDIADLRESGLWLASRHITPVSGKGRLKVEAINNPVMIGGIPVNPGDLIVGDDTGVVCISAQRLQEVFLIAEELRIRDVRFAEALSGGETFTTAAARLKHM